MRDWHDRRVAVSSSGTRAPQLGILCLGRAGFSTNPTRTPGETVADSLRIPGKPPMSAEAGQPLRVRPELAKLSTPIDELMTHPDNPLRGNVDAIAESLRTHGQYRPIVADEAGVVLAGNHTLLAARQLGWTEIAAVFVDVDEDTARRILLVDNRTADLGTYDDTRLVELLRSIATTDDALTGTGSSGPHPPATATPSNPKSSAYSPNPHRRQSRTRRTRTPRPTAVLSVVTAREGGRATPICVRLLPGAPPRRRRGAPR